MSISVQRSGPRALTITGLCGFPPLLTILVAASGALDAVVVRTVPDPYTRAADLGIGELEMGPDFGRPTVARERGPVATALLYVVLMLCPAKFVFLWALQRRESRQAGAPRGRAPGSAGG